MERISRSAKKGKKLARRMRGATALTLAGAMAVSCVPAMAAETKSDGVHPTYDEAYYATLDYYGNLTNGSVVKSYTMNGATSLTDYGTYDEVVNLTDSTEPSTADGKTTFTFDKSPEHFYFEGNTAEPFNAMPWTLSVTYDLNGVPAKAEDLAGATGVVAIHINAVPNAAASDYAKNNYTLEAMAAFNQDDILSLTAEGGQAQLLGNLRVVMFAVMPGEEQHFTISVGANDFSFDGLTFLLAPATLSQLNDIKELKDKESEIEDSYDKLNSSIDTLLDSLTNMSGSLNSAAEGLDELNDARSDVSSGKDGVISSADAALSDLDGLNDSLGKVSGHLDTAAEAADAVTKSLNTVNATVKTLKDDIGCVQSSIDAIQADLSNIKSTAGTSDSSGIRGELTQLGADIAALQANLATVRPLLAQLQLGVGTGSTRQDITIQGMTMTEVNEALDKAKSLETLYSAVGGGDSLSYSEYLVAAQMAGGTSKTDAASNVSGLVQLSSMSAAAAQAAAQQAGQTAAASVLSSGGTQEAAQSAATAAATAFMTKYYQAQLLLKVYEASVNAGKGGDTSAKMTEPEFVTAMLMINDYKTKVAAGGDSSAVLAAVLAAAPAYYKNGASLVTLYDESKTGLLANMTALCDTLGANGLTGSMNTLTAQTASTITDLNTLLDYCDGILQKADTLIDETTALNTVINKYEPDLKTALSDTKELVGSVSTTVSDTHGFLTTFGALMKKVGPKVDDGTKKTLSGLSSTLRQAAKSMNSVSGVKSAKKDITGLIDDTWNEYTGKENNLLNMDPDATIESLTSEQNAEPQSVQMLIRTQEIKADDGSGSGSSSSSSSDDGTFMSRFVQMFKDLWHDFTHLI
jgi:putative membrane protein